MQPYIIVILAPEKTTSFVDSLQGHFGAAGFEIVAVIDKDDDAITAIIDLADLSGGLFFIGEVSTSIRDARRAHPATPIAFLGDIPEHEAVPGVFATQLVEAAVQYLAYEHLLGQALAAPRAEETMAAAAA